MQCPKCDFGLDDGDIECPRCGIVIEKYLERQRTLSEAASEPQPSASAQPSDPAPRSLWVQARPLLLEVPDSVSTAAFAGRALLLAILVVWGLRFILAPLESNYVGRSFLHLVNLPFHEAGHIVFLPFGKFLSTLGGTLGQLLMPLVCLGVFLLKTRDTFGAAVALWWMGESFLDIAPYINDAQARRLILLGGVTGRDVEGYHDWEYILGRLHMLPYDHVLARMAQATGILLMVAALVWAGYLLYRQRGRLGGC